MEQIKQSPSQRSQVPAKRNREVFEASVIKTEPPVPTAQRVYPPTVPVNVVTLPKRRGRKPTNPASIARAAALAQAQGFKPELHNAQALPSMNMPCPLTPTLEELRDEANQELQRRQQQLSTLKRAHLSVLARSKEKSVDSCDLLGVIGTVMRSENSIERVTTEVERAQAAMDSVQGTLCILDTISRLYDQHPELVQSDGGSGAPGAVTSTAITRNSRTMKVIITKCPPVKPPPVSDEVLLKITKGDASKAAAAKARLAEMSTTGMEQSARDKKAIRLSFQRQVQAQPVWLSWYVTDIRNRLGIHEHGWMSVQVNQYRCFACNAMLLDVNRTSGMCPNCRGLGGSMVQNVTADMLQPDGAGRDRSLFRGNRKPGQRGGGRGDLRSVQRLQTNLGEKQRKLEVSPEVERLLCEYYIQCGFDTPEKYQTTTSVDTEYFLWRIEREHGIKCRDLMGQLADVHRRITGVAAPAMPRWLNQKVKTFNSQILNAWATVQSRKQDRAASVAQHDDSAEKGTENQPNVNTRNHVIVVYLQHPEFVWWLGGSKKAKLDATVHEKLTACFNQLKIPYAPTQNKLMAVYRQIEARIEMLESKLPPLGSASKQQRGPKMRRVAEGV